MSSADSLEDYSRAVHLCFDLASANSHSSRELQHEAQLYCERVENEQQGWSLALRLLCQSSDARVHFHCLQVLQRLIQDPARWAGLQEAGHNAAIRMTLLARDASRDPRFVRTKLGVVLALLIKREYPGLWARAFDDLLATLRLNAAAADVFLWTLVALDEEVISQPGPEATEIKDAMRVDAVQPIVQTLVHLMAPLEASDSDLAKRCLGVLGSLVTWADLALFVDNEQFVRLLLSHLCSPIYACAALQFAQSLVKKGMPPANKVTLVARLGLADVAVALSAQLPRAELSVSSPPPLQLPPPAAMEQTAWAALGPRYAPALNDEEACLETARFVDMLGTELLLARQAALEQHDGAVLAQAQPLLDRVIFALFACLECAFFAAQDAVVELASQVSSTLVFDVPTAVRMAYAVLSSARYPALYDFDLDSDEDFAEHRRVVKKLFVSLCRHVGPRALLRPFFRDALQALLGETSQLHPFPEYSQTEALLYLLHALAEGCPELVAQRQQQQQQQGAPPHDLEESARFCPAASRAHAPLRDFDLLLEFVFKSSALPRHPHRAVVIMFNELVARYALQLKAQPLEVVAHVLASLTSPCGCFHPHPKVRTRACNALLRVVKLVQEPRLAETVLLAIQPGLELGGDKAASGSDALTLFEAVGVIVGGNWTSPARRSGFLRMVIQPLQRNLDSAVGQWLQRPQDDSLVQWAAASIEALALVVKGFSAKIEDPAVVQLLTLSLQAALETARVVHPSSHAAANRIPGNARRLCHALIPTVGLPLVSFLPAVCQALLDPPDADVAKTCDLINQMMSAFKTSMLPALSAALVPVLRSINAHAAPLLAQPSPTPNDVLEARELEKTLFVFLHSVASSELSPALLSEDNQPHLLELLGMLAHGLQSGRDAAMQRVCALTLQLLLRDWFPIKPELDHEPLYVSLKAFFFERVTAASFGATSLPSFDPHDAGCATLLVAVCALHKTLAERLGPTWLDYLLRVFFPAALCPQPAAEQYVKAITSSKNPKELRAHYRRLFMAGISRQDSS